MYPVSCQISEALEIFDLCFVFLSEGLFKPLVPMHLAKFCLIVFDLLFVVFLSLQLSFVVD